MRTAAAWLAEQLAFAGGRLVETGGHPVVLGEWLGAPGAPTILVYGHYDVQPPGDAAEWETPPFEPTVRDGRIYARGATDDKGPVFIALKVAEAFHSQTGRLPLNVRFLFEGEEEIGSPSLPAFLEAHARRARGRPRGLRRRGDVAADRAVALDRGQGAARARPRSSPARAQTCTPAATAAPSRTRSTRWPSSSPACTHPTARSRSRASTTTSSPRRARRDALERVPFDEESYRRQVGVPVLHGEPGYSTLERLWTRPTLEVNGIQGGGPYTVIPRSSRAHITCRLAPGQSPEAVLAAITGHIAAHVPRGVEARVEAARGAVPAYSIAADHRAVVAASAALRTVYPDREPLLVRIGGTLPAAVLFEQILGLKTLLFSFSISDENLHAPNEFFRLERLEEGMRAWAELWTRLAEELSTGNGVYADERT